MKNIEMLEELLLLLIAVVFGTGLGLIIRQNQIDEMKYKISELERNRYDVNLDGDVNASDYVLIKNYIMNQITTEELKKYCPNVKEKLDEFMGGEVSET